MEQPKPMDSPGMKHARKHARSTEAAPRNVTVSSKRVSISKDEPEAQQQQLRNNVQIWATVLEGRGFPSGLSDTHVHMKMAPSKIRLDGKHQSFQTAHPKWGETFVFDRLHHETDLEIVVESGTVLASKVFELHIPIKSIIDRGHVYRWLSEEQSETSSPKSPGAQILVHIRVMPLDPIAALRRLHSLRFEMPTLHVGPNGTLKGCLVFSVNRPRFFTKAHLRLEHGTFTNPGDLESPTKDYRQYFNIKMELPRSSFHSKDAKEDASIEKGFTITPGLYFWPFEFTMPDKLYKTEELKASGRSWTTFCHLSVVFHSKAKVGGGQKAKKQKMINISVDSTVSAPPVDEGNLELVMKIDEPKCKFFSNAAFVPDVPESPVFVERALESLVGAKGEKIPAAGCCADVDKCLYGSA